MLHILLIEDNQGDVRLLQEMLREADQELEDDYQVTHVERVLDAVDYLSSIDISKQPVDVILSDITLPDSHGRETFALLGKTASTLPVVFMTGASEEGFAVDAIHQGAQDYLVKGRITGDGLARTLLFAVERKKVQLEMSRVRADAEASEQRVKLLAQQKRQLMALNRTKDEFISLASHQLRTPATAVKQYIGMIIEGYVGDVDDAQLPLLQTAYASNERQLEIINELLKTAQLDSNRYELALQPTDLGRLIRGVIEEHRPIIELRHQQLVFDAAGTCQALVDPTEFKLVLTNLIENASKYTPADKYIRVSLRRVSKKLQIAIRDEGVGIGPDDQKRIFDKFTRVDNELSDTVTGSGLGLYWVRKIMRLHKGSVEVTSALGKGSTFTLSLPL